MGYRGKNGTENLSGASAMAAVPGVETASREHESEEVGAQEQLLSLMNGMGLQRMANVLLCVTRTNSA